MVEGRVQKNTKLGLSLSHRETWISATHCNAMHVKSTLTINLLALMNSSFRRVCFHVGFKASSSSSVIHLDVEVQEFWVVQTYLPTTPHYTQNSQNAAIQLSY